MLPSSRKCHAIGSSVHAAGAFAHRAIEVARQRVLFDLVRSDYSQPAAYLFVDGLTAVGFNNPKGTRAP
jgi:hypothetical protein